MSEEEMMMKKQVEYFYKNKISVFIKKTNGRIYNGLIIEYQSDLIILNDRYLGAMPIYFIEINVLEKMRENG